jgi:hypothetical protein
MIAAAASVGRAGGVDEPLRHPFSVRYRRSNSTRRAPGRRAPSGRRAGHASAGECSSAPQRRPRRPRELSELARRDGAADAEPVGAGVQCAAAEVVRPLERAAAAVADLDVDAGGRVVESRNHGTALSRSGVHGSHTSGVVRAIKLEGDAIAAITYFADTAVIPHFGLPRTLRSEAGRSDLGRYLNHPRLLARPTPR